MSLRSCAIVLLLLFATQPARGQGTVEAAECVSKPLDLKARCGFVTVPEDYAEPGAGAVEIHYAIAPSRSSPPAPDPVVYLVGGPGSSGSRLLPLSFDKYLSAFAGERDIVVIDQRGTGLSKPALYCHEALYRLHEILQSHHAAHAELLLEILGDCRRRLAGAGVRFDNFHTYANARDVAEVLLALGYESWNLVGVSYGSRLALAMMRDYPRRVRSAILDSVYPPQADIYIDSYFNGERALDAVFSACETSPACAERYPDLAAVFHRLYARLNAQPLTAPYQPPRMPKLTIEISGYRLYDWVFNWLYEVDSIALIPYLITELERGRTADAARVGVAFEAAMISLSLGMHYSVQCQEEYGLVERDYTDLLAAHPHLRGFLRYPVEGPATLPRLCAMWRDEALPGANDAVVSDVPALLLSGHFDPITPPAYADLAQRTLSRAYSFTLPHVGHGVLRSDACAARIAAAFIDNPGVEPDSACIADMQPIAFR